MYNIDYLPQLEDFHRNFFGRSEVPAREISDEVHIMYSTPERIEILACEEDINGEWVPKKNHSPLLK